MAINDSQGPVVLSGGKDSGHNNEIRMDSGFNVAQSVTVGEPLVGNNSGQTIAPVVSPGNAPGPSGSIPGATPSGSANAPGGTAVNQPSTTAATTPSTVQFDSSSGQPIRLPAGTSLENIEIIGKNLVIKQPGVADIVILNGANRVPSLSIDGVSVPASTLAAVFQKFGITPALGADGQLFISA